MLPERAQKTMSVFELCVYSPTIEETWKKSGIKGLKIEHDDLAGADRKLESVASQSG
jgi:hypothetical protein